MKTMLAGAALALAAVPGAAEAGEIFGGVYAHNIDTPLSLGDHVEDGVDLQLGWRGSAIARPLGIPLQPYVVGALNTAGDTSYAGAGIASKFGDRLYIRPGLGVAVHDGSTADFENPFNDEVELGARIIFLSEIAVGVRVAPRITAEASLVHLSHGQLYGGQNPGIDNIGVRVNVQLP